MRIILTICILILTNISGLACNCDGTLSIDQAIKNADFIFAGRVKSVSPVYKEGYKNVYVEVLVEFTVDTIYKGGKTKTVKIKTWSSSGMCGFPFKQDESYLVYSTKIKVANGFEFHTDLCDRTKKMANASYDIPELNHYLKNINDK